MQGKEKKKSVSLTFPKLQYIPKLNTLPLVAMLPEMKGHPKITPKKHLFTEITHSWNDWILVYERENQRR